jgi:hypothetical protein
MTRLTSWMAIGAALVLAACGGPDVSDNQLEAFASALKQVNLSGPHYTLNIHGVPNAKTADMTGSDTHSIFVPEDGKAKINLSEGPFQVLDGNGTDGTAAFQLPDPDPTNSGTTVYSVWARALGKPGGSATAQTCATDPTTGEVWCSTSVLTLSRKSGQPLWGNVSQYLLYIYADLDLDGTLERYNLFNTALTDYFWSWDNQGLKLAQLRFYAMPTVVP